MGSDTCVDDRFGRVPYDFVVALEQGEIGLDEWAVGTFLLCRADWFRNRAIYTLRALADAIGWRKSTEALRQSLGQLRDGGWINYEVRKGMRSPYVISLERLHRHYRHTEEDTSPDERLDEAAEPWK